MRDQCRTRGQTPRFLAFARDERAYAREDTAFTIYAIAQVLVDVCTSRATRPHC